MNQPKSGYALAVLGGTERKGVWRMPCTLRVLTCMGGTTLDFREAILAPGATEVPEPDPEAPLLRIRGFVIMGGVDVETGLPGESEKEARKRRRRERRQRRRQRHLPA